MCYNMDKNQGDSKMLKKGLIEVVQDCINSDEMRGKYRRDGKCFVRTRKLSFGLLIIMILRKSVKSLQLILNELADELGIGSISNSAFTQRRALLRHGFFKELNQKQTC